VLATIDAAGRPHAVPVCFAIVAGEVVTAIDQKPKSTTRPARLVNVERAGTATMMFDRWDEDWTRLGWVMVRGRARVEPPGTAPDELVDRYSQYRESRPAGNVIVVTPDDIVWWTYE
jgi:PPOX class probable F420-dependent enzyme